MYDNNDNNDFNNTQPQGEYSNHQNQEVHQPVYKSPQKKNNAGGKVITAAVCTALCFGSLGIGLGIGSNMNGSLFGKSNESSIAVAESNADKNSETAKFGSFNAKDNNAESSVPKVDFEDEVKEDVSEETAQPQFTMNNTALAAEDMDLVDVIKSVSNSVVSINVQGLEADYFNRLRDTQSAGSGIIFSEDSENIYIATNNHVITNANQVSISIDDTKSAPASPMGSDAQSDLAVIKVSKTDLIKADITDYAVAAFGDAESMEVGETVIAIGNALGQGKSATVGIISAKNKQISAENNEYVDIIQTDAAINAGNSGGALVNLEGKVIGINTAKLAAAGVEGMGFAIPSNTVKEVIDSIMEDGSVVRPFIGISGLTISDEIKESYSIPVYGVFVMEVLPNGSANAAGISAGDIITAFNGVEIKTIEALQEEISKTDVGDKVAVEVFRFEGTQTLTVEILDSNSNKTF